MRLKAGRGALVVATLGALAWTGATPAVAQEERGIDPNQGRSLVEVTLDSRAAAMRLQLDADRTASSSTTTTCAATATAR